MVWIEISYIHAFGHRMPALLRPKARRLKCKDPQCDNFIRYWKDSFAVAQVERQGEASEVQSAAAIIMANEAADNDADADEHLPDSPEEDDAQHLDHGKDVEDEGQQDEQQEAGQQERPVEVISEAAAKDTVTYAR